MSRTVVSLALAFSLAFGLAGCLDRDGAGDTGTPTPPTGATNATLPAPIEDSREVTGGADPLNAAGQPQCATPQNQCQRYPFTLNASATITAQLSWTVPANDFDLYVFQDGAPVLGDGTAGATSPPGTSEEITGELDAGDYEVVVVPWGVARDTYTLSATFS